MKMKFVLLMLFLGFASQLQATIIDLSGDETLTVNPGDSYVEVFMKDNSKATVLGGTIDFDYYSEIDNDSIMTISGGNILGHVFVRSDALIQLSGSDFMVGNIPVGIGNLDLQSLTDLGALSYLQTEVDEWRGSISGILDDGTSIEFDFHILRPYSQGVDHFSNIEIVPEPISLCLLSLGGLLTIKRRK